MRQAARAMPWLLATLVVLLWAVQSGEERAAPVIAALLATGIGLILAWRIDARTPAGSLRWDGQDWHWASAAGTLVGTVSSRMDWQGGLLLEFHARQGGSRWIWLERRADPLRWHALRCAVHARQMSPADGAAEAESQVVP